MTEFPTSLGDIRRQIETLDVPTAVYAGIGVTEDTYYFCFIDSDQATALSARIKDNGADEILRELKNYMESTNTKIIATGLFGEGDLEKLGSRLWLELDTVPVILRRKEVSEASVHAAACHVCGHFDTNHLARVPLSDDNEVRSSFLVTAEDYEKTVPTKGWQFIMEQAQEFAKRDSQITFFSATPQGGGVALMRHAMMRFYRLIGVDAHWHVLEPNRDVFDVTKTKFHNVLQGVADDEVRLNDHDRQIFNAWSKENANRFKDRIASSTTIVIDDPQPSGLIPHIKQINPNAKLIYRSHIHLDASLTEIEGSPQYDTWQFIWNNAQHCDKFLSHPVEKFIPPSMFDQTLTMPAATDLLDGLNKPLSSDQIDYYLRLFDRILLEHDQTPLDHMRPYITQIARFDPSKGIPDVIESYRLLRDKLGADMAPQLVLVGHGSIDDPDGIPIYNLTMNILRSGRYSGIAEDIKVVRLHHNDQILNTILRSAHVCLQLSLKEGYEIKVSEALQKGVPVVANRTGGIPLQIEDEVTGFLADAGNCQEIANHLYELFTDQELYERTSKNAAEKSSPKHFTIYNAAKWIYLSNALAADTKLPGNAESVASVIGPPIE